MTKVMRWWQKRRVDDKKEGLMARMRVYFDCKVRSSNLGLYTHGFTIAFLFEFVTNFFFPQQRSSALRIQNVSIQQFFYF